MNNKIIKIKDLSFSYKGSNNILNNISIDFDENEITGILGRNGSGKSTLLECIMRFNSNYNGQILLNDRNIREYSLQDFSRIVTYMPQNINTTIEFKVMDYLIFGRAPYLSSSSIPQRSDFEIVYMYAKKIGIDNILDKCFNQLSGGEKKLVRITKILIQETKIILFDEPTASLDYGNQYKILELLKELRREGKTIIFTIHNPNQLLEYNFKTVVLCNSKVLAQGQAKDAIDNNVIKTVYGENFIVDNNKCLYKGKI